MAITVQEAQVIFSADGLNQVKTQAGAAGIALDRTSSKAGMLDGKLKSLRSSLGGIGTMLAGLGAGAAATWMMKLSAGAEQTAIAFEVLLGSQSASKQMIDDMRALDMKTVFGFRELSDAAKMMLNYGVAGNDVVPMLEVISDIASGDAMKLEMLTRAFGQMSATGRLMGQDLNQMINGGFNPLKEISDRTGISMAVLKKRMEDGQISAQMVAEAFRSATSAGGRFYGMNDRMSQTTAGQFAKLKSNIELLAIEIGTTLLPEANKLIEWSTKLVTGVDGIGTSFTKMIATVKTWYQNVSDNLADIGVVVGTIVGHISTVWEGLWLGLKNHAQAFFDWITQNGAIAAANIATGVQNALNAVQGKEMVPFQAMKAFVAPQPVNMGKQTPLGQQIRDELDAARKIRMEQRAEKVKEERGVKGIGGAGDETKAGSRGGKRFEFGVGGAGADGEKSRTLSAEALFGSLREGALNKQLGIMNKGINLQQQQLAAANQLVAKVDKLNLGLA